MTEVLPGRGLAALTADPRSREAPYDGINYRAPRPAGLLLILSIAGLVHERRVPADTEMLAKTVHPSTVNA
jgi:hypothetical protein